MQIQVSGKMFPCQLHHKLRHLNLEVVLRKLCNKGLGNFFLKFQQQSYSFIYLGSNYFQMCIRKNRAPRNMQINVFDIGFARQCCY